MFVLMQCSAKCPVHICQPGQEVRRKYISTHLAREIVRLGANVLTTLPGKRDEHHASHRSIGVEQERDVLKQSSSGVRGCVLAVLPVDDGGKRGCSEGEAERWASTWKVGQKLGT